MHFVGTGRQGMKMMREHDKTLEREEYPGLSGNRPGSRGMVSVKIVVLAVAVVVIVISTASRIYRKDGTVKHTLDLALYNLMNLAFVACVFHRTNNVYSDGPSGFAEALLLGPLSLFAITLYIIGFNMPMSDKPDSRPRMIGLASIFVILAGIATLAVDDMCSNANGYCRNWQLVMDGR
jgi:hypothetical protein